MFAISNQSDYAMLLLEYLADKRRPVPISKIVADLRLPARYLSRIAAKLAKERILKSKEGSKGGHKLAKPLSKISVLAILQIFEHDLRFTKCSADNYQCQFEKFCQHSVFWKNKLEQEFLAKIEKLTLAEIIKSGIGK